MCFTLGMRVGPAQDASGKVARDTKVYLWTDTLPRFNSSPLKSYQNPVEKWSSNHHGFQGRAVKLRGCIQLIHCPLLFRLPASKNLPWVHSQALWWVSLGDFWGTCGLYIFLYTIFCSNRWVSICFLNWGETGIKLPRLSVLFATAKAGGWQGDGEEDVYSWLLKMWIKGRWYEVSHIYV